ncbi:MAG TPA: TspO/MBR family protein [Sandaracinaceae bacterium LLY-WYZ-13_1]|nr:TspO/MBR family protein [Sandaracinaceae bacterium LLY-WYZ-13_1]
MAHTISQSSPSRPGLGRLLLYVAGFVGIALAINGWIFATGAGRWARTLANPSWSPPGAVIGAVWVVLFGLMAAALHAVDRRGTPGRRSPARVGILAQYAVNVGWTWAYFGLRNVANGFYVTVLAWVLCVGVIVLAWRATRAAALLLLPLQGWLTFALALSWVTWRLNA